MDKAQLLELIKLLSALESWAYATGGCPPKYLSEKLTCAINLLVDEVLKCQD